MKIPYGYGLFIFVLAVIFTIGLTFASIELPGLLDSLLEKSIQVPSGDSFANDISVFRTEAFIQHYHLRFIGYVCFILLILLIIIGFITNKHVFASLGAFAFFMPVFAQFASVMFFLAGLGIFNLLMMPVLDISSDILRFGDIAYFPYRLLVSFAAKWNYNIQKPLIYTFIGTGLMLFVLGTFAWLYSKIQKKDIADFWVYRISRHPQYLGWIIWSYGMMLSLVFVRYPKRSWGIPSSLPWLLSMMVIIGVAMLEEVKLLRMHKGKYEIYRQRAPFLFPLPRFLSKLFALPTKLFFKKEYPDRKREVTAVITFYTAVLIISSVFYINYTSIIGMVKYGFTQHKSNQVNELVRVLKENPNRRTKDLAASSLGKLGEPAVDSLITLLKHDDAVVREFSALTLGKIKSPRAFEPLVECLSDENANVRSSAVTALGDIRDKRAEQYILPLLDDTKNPIWRNAADALGKIGSENAVDKLIVSLRDSSLITRFISADALGRIASEKAAEPLAKALSDEQVSVRRSVVVALLKIKSEKSIEALKKTLYDEDWEVRFYAAEALRKIGTSEALEAVKKH
jgi:HEAT repeat protein